MVVRMATLEEPLTDKRAVVVAARENMSVRCAFEELASVEARIVGGVVFLHQPYHCPPYGRSSTASTAGRLAVAKYY